MDGKTDTVRYIEHIFSGHKEINIYNILIKFISLFVALPT